MSPCEQVTEELAAIVDGDREVIARHADHLAGCDACRDARHEASALAGRIAEAGADYVPGAALVDRLVASIDREPIKAAPQIAAAPPPPAATQKTKPSPTTGTTASRPWMRAGAALAAMAAASTVYVAATHHRASDPQGATPTEKGPIGKLATITRAAADKADGVMLRVARGEWRPLHANEPIPAGAELRTDERTRTALDLADGTHVVLDHLTTLAFAADEPRHLTLTAGRIVADVAHVDARPASVTTPAGIIDVVGTRFEATAAAEVTAVQVVRGEVVLRDRANGHESVRAGEEGLIDHGALSVSPTMGLASEVAWSELATPAKTDDGLAGIGALRAYKPGETRDRDWNLALAKHDVRVRISGPIARTEITEVFRNDSAQQLEGVYQFPLPADAQIDGLSLDVDHGFVDGAFVDKDRANKIWKGVIDRARPIQQARPEEIVWVPGPWRDPALLDWKRGGRFELRIFPIPAKGERTIKLSYTQVVTPRGPWRQYVYPLAHSSDGSTVADTMSVDVEVRGAAPGMVRATNYPLKFTQGGFVPRGDLVVDYMPDNNAELRAWTFQGGAAVAPDAKLADKKNVGIDPKVIAEQTLVAGDARPTAVIALQPKLPRWTDSKPRDYTIVIDDSQSMVGERFKRASELASTLVAQLDRRDRFTAMLCDSECKTYGALRTPSASSAADLSAWLKGQTLAGASDLVTSVRTAAAAMTDAQREHWVLYIGDGFATTGFRKAADVEHALADSTGTNDTHVTTIGIGSDADETVLAAAARGGGGSFLAWQPGMTAGATAVAALETTYGATLRDATLVLPAGLVDSAPTVLPSLRSGQQVLVSARLANEVSGDVVLKGKLAGQPWEQRYPIKLAAAASSANGFVPRLWASLAIGELERAGKGEDRVKEVALSQAYGVMSRETSLLVLESQAMFDAFGVDRHRPTATWSGEDGLDEVTASGSEPQAQAAPAGGPPATAPAAAKDFAKTDKKSPEHKPSDFGGDATSTMAPPAPAANAGFGEMERARDVAASRPAFHGRGMIAMHRVWTRIAAVATYTGVDPALTKEIASSEAALAAAPDSREKHRALVQALSYAGELDRAKQVAARWLERDRLDPQALGYLADLAGRDGERDQSLRTLAGLVDLDPDRVALHERMVNAYERTGRLAQACGHRIALATIQRSVAAAAGAARCLRMVGRTNDATLVMGELADDTQRGAAERLATVAPIAPRLAGDLVVRASWDATADLDLTLVAPDGTRVSWQGGRSDVMVEDATAHDREELAVKTLRRGNYLLEITRGDVARSPIRGTLDVTVLGVKKSLPFELTGTHAVVGHVNVALQSHLEPFIPN